MAKQRVRLEEATSSLRAMGETQRIVARPVDSYVRPALQTGAAEKAKQIFSALSQVEPKLLRYVEEEKKQYKADQAELGEKTYANATPEERKKYADQIKNGEITELESPFWVEGYARSLLKGHAKEYGEDLLMEWDKNKDNPAFDFSAWATQYRQKYQEANQLNGFRADLFNDEFVAVTDAFDAQVRQRNFEYQLDKARKARMDGYSSDLQIMFEGFSQQIADGKWDEATQAAAVKLINDKALQVHTSGSDAKKVLETAIGFFEGKALAAARSGQDFEPWLNIMAQFKIKGPAYGISNADRMERLRNELTTDRENAINKADEDWLKARTVEQARLGDDIITKVTQSGFDLSGDNSWWLSEEGVKARTRMEQLNPSRMRQIEEWATRGGRVVQDSDPKVVDSIYEGMQRGEDQSQEIDVGVSNGTIKPADGIRLKQLNQGVYTDFINTQGLQNIHNSVRTAITQTKGLSSLLDDNSRNDLAIEAQSVLQRYVMDRLDTIGKNGYTAENARVDILKRQADIIKEYTKKAETRALQTTLPNVPIASENEVTQWRAGKSPWKDQTTGEFKRTPDQLTSDLDNFIRALEKRGPEGNSASALADALNSTELGRMIAPLVAAGEDPNLIIQRLVTEVTGERTRLKAQREEDRRTDPLGVADLREDDYERAKLESRGAIMFQISPQILQGRSITQVMELTSPTSYGDDGSVAARAFSGFYKYILSDGSFIVSGEHPRVHNITATRFSASE